MVIPHAVCDSKRRSEFGWYHVAEQCLNQHTAHINVLIASFARHLAKRTLAKNATLTVPSWPRPTSKVLGCMSAYP